MAEKDPNSPATTSFAYDEMLPRWSMIQSLLSGTRTLRDEGETYLPKHDQESDDNYRERLETNTLFNMTELTLDSWVGRPFSKPIVANPDVPDDVENLLEDIDLQGNNITVFCREWFRESLAKSFSHVLIDFPVLTDEEREGRTREDDIREGRRPYWIHITPENLIFAESMIIDGQEVLTHIRITEDIVTRSGFAETVTERIRVLEPGRFEIWEKVKTKRSKEEWVIIDFGETGIDIIPLVTFYADRNGLMLGKPPVEDLSHLNIRHWQSTSDQNNILTVARFPMLAVSGAADATGESMRIGPRQMLGTRDPSGKFYYVEHSGKAIDAGRQDILDLEEQMAAYGANFLRRRTGDVTKAEIDSDSAQTLSPLQDRSVRFQDAVNNALIITAMWLGIEDGGTVSLTTDFGPSVAASESLRALGQARKEGLISGEEFIAALQSFGVLPEDFQNDRTGTLDSPPEDVEEDKLE